MDDSDGVIEDAIQEPCSFNDDADGLGGGVGPTTVPVEPVWPKVFAE